MLIFNKRLLVETFIDINQYCIYIILYNKTVNFNRSLPRMWAGGSEKNLKKGI